MNIPDPQSILEGVERAATLLRVFGPVAKDLESYIFHGGAEPALFESLPELRSPAALERAKHAARSNPPVG